MEVHVNYLAVLLAAASSMVIGSIWYARPVLGNTWIKLVKLDNKKMNTGAAQSMIIAAVLSLVMAYVLAHLAYLAHYFFRNSFLQDAVSTAFWVWLGVAFTRVLTHDSFEQRPIKLTAINLANMLVTMLAMGVIIGLLHP
jgi:hypothetical protein